MNSAIVTLILALAAALPVAAQDPQENDHDATMRHGFEGVERWVKIFEDPERDTWQKPTIVIRVIGIDDHDTVADIGAGTGYFTRVLSRSMGEEGKVYAVDIEPEMLEYIDKRDDMGRAEVVTVLAEPDDPKLPPGEVDLVVVVDTWHHIDDRLNYLKKLEEALSPAGRVVIIDFREGDLPVGPPAGHKLSRDAVAKEFDKAGWRLVTESVALPYQYFLVFYPPRG